jgi:hypothetical protein
MKNEKILDFYTSKKSISKNRYVMKGKTELLMNFKKNSIPTVEMLHKEMKSLCNFYFFKIAKIEPANKIQSFFLK